MDDIEGESIHKPIYSKMQEKTTDELYRIWRVSDTEEWTPEALAAARQVLQERIGRDPDADELDEPDEIDTYSNLDSVSNLASWANVLSWVFLVYIVITFIPGVLRASNEATGLKAIVTMGENLLSPLIGLVLFIFLKAISHVIYLFMDIEDNTRRMAKAVEHGKLIQ